MLLKKPLIWLVVIVSWLCVPKHTPGATQSRYIRLEALGTKSLDLDFSYCENQVTGRRVRYRLFLPNPFDRSIKYPLVIWLHGLGDHGTDNLSQLVHLDDTIFPGGETKDCQFFVCAPQCSNGIWMTEFGETNNNADHSVGGADRDMLDVTVKIIDELQTQYPIDDRRITVVGISDGGTACWDLLNRQPHRFASVVPLGDGGGSPGLSIDSMIHTPIWAFHAAGDPQSPVEGVERTTKLINAAGGKALLTLTDDNRHNCWSKAFAEHDLLRWILKQRLDDTNSPLPGSYRLAVSLRLWWNENWPRLVLLFAVGALVTACYRHVRSFSGYGCSRKMEKDFTIAASSNNSSDCAFTDFVVTGWTAHRGELVTPDFSKIGTDP